MLGLDCEQKHGTEAGGNGNVMLKRMMRVSRTERRSNANILETVQEEESCWLP